MQPHFIFKMEEEYKCGQLKQEGPPSRRRYFCGTNSLRPQVAREICSTDDAMCCSRCPDFDLHFPLDESKGRLLEWAILAATS